MQQAVTPAVCSATGHHGSDHQALDIKLLQRCPNIAAFHTLLSQVYGTTTKTGKWISQDGSAIDYDAIDPKAEFFDPQRENLFEPDDEPNDEQYEGFTGNTGRLHWRLCIAAKPALQAAN